MPENAGLLPTSMALLLLAATTLTFPLGKAHVLGEECEEGERDSLRGSQELEPSLKAAGFLLDDQAAGR